MDKSLKLNVVTISNGSVNFDVILDDSLETLQEFVGGYIEIPAISNVLIESKIDMIINENGKLIPLPPTVILTKNDKIIDVIHGNIIFASHDSHGNTIGLSESQVGILKNIFKTTVAVNGIGVVYEIKVF